MTHDYYRDQFGKTLAKKDIAAHVFWLILFGSIARCVRKKKYNSQWDML